MQISHPGFFFFLDLSASLQESLKEKPWPCGCEGHACFAFPTQKNGVVFFFQVTKFNRHPNTLPLFCFGETWLPFKSIFYFIHYTKVSVLTCSLKPEQNLQHSKKGLVKPWFNVLYVNDFINSLYFMRVMPYKKCSGQNGTKERNAQTAHQLIQVKALIGWIRSAWTPLRPQKADPVPFAMLWSFLCFWPACREQMISWMFSHPRTDLWATMVSGSVFRFRVIGELPFDVQMSTHIVNSNQLPMHRLPVLPWPHPCLLLFQQKQTQIFILVWILFYLRQFYLPLIVSNMDVCDFSKAILLSQRPVFLEPGGGWVIYSHLGVEAR